MNAAKFDLNGYIIIARVVHNVFVAIKFETRVNEFVQTVRVWRCHVPIFLARLMWSWVIRIVIAKSIRLWHIRVGERARRQTSCEKMRSRERNVSSARSEKHFSRRSCFTEVLSSESPTEFGRFSRKNGSSCVPEKKIIFRNAREWTKFVLLKNKIDWMILDHYFIIIIFFLMLFQFSTLSFEIWRRA